MDISCAAPRELRILNPEASTFLPCPQATPSADSAMFFYYTNSLGFDAEFMGRVRLLGRWVDSPASGCAYF